MNKQEMNLLNDIRLLIEERNALRADKEALIDALRHTVSNCDHCQNNYNKPCDVTPGHDLDCVTCSGPCVCHACRDGSHFVWIGRSEMGKHAAKEPAANDMPVGVQRAMEENKRTKER